jgi:hypothetical protein
MEYIKPNSSRLAAGAAAVSGMPQARLSLTGRGHLSTYRFFQK